MSLAGLLYTAALGICNDKSADCHAWQAAGQCTANSEYMHYMCPLSCGVGTVFSSDKTPSLHAAPSVSSLGLSFCSHSFYLSLVPPSLSGSREQTCLHNCSDTEESCLEWTRQGECLTNTLFMLRACPVACGVCTPECADTHGGYQHGPLANESMCELWAREGACEGNPDFALVHCPVACGVCKPKCKDLDGSCSAWGAAGQCVDNPKFMLKTCPATCRVCGHSADHPSGSDPGDTQTQPTLRDEGHGCLDTESTEACAEWVKNSECDANPYAASHSPFVSLSSSLYAPCS
jgi:hypothetical protein